MEKGEDHSHTRKTGRGGKGEGETATPAKMLKNGADVAIEKRGEKHRKKKLREQ